jgi:phosphohistidine phosphatase SixA
MNLYLARHAWAGHFGDPEWPDDSLRELSPEGAERYARVVQALAGRGFAPTRIATSPYARCRQTAELIAEHTLTGAVIDQLEALEPGSDLRALIEWTNQHKGEDACWVGHNPDMEFLAAALLGDGQAEIRFAKGSIAAIRFGNDGIDSTGTLYWHLTAKALGL